MKKTRPNSVSVLPSHSQFKDKPIADGSSLGGLGAFAGRLTLRRIILAVGGLLFVYITITTIFGPTPEHLRKGPTAVRPEADPYLDVPKDSNNNRDKSAADIKPPPIEKEDNNLENHPWREPDHREPLQQGSGLDPPGLKNQNLGTDDEGDVSLGTENNNNNNIISNNNDNNNNNSDNNNSGVNDDELQEEPEEESTEVTPLSIATKARKNSPVTYAQLLAANKIEFEYAIALLLREADMALKNTEVYSVTNKDQTAPSKDIHDYLSLSKYYWPNEKTKDGLPYVRRDGHINPEIETVKDYRLLRTMIREVHMMGMAYHFTGNKEYADKCAMRLKEWFLDEKTYMNPNINYGSLQKGQQLGARTGVLDMFPIFR